LEETVLIALPGVPSEMKANFEETVALLLKQVSGRGGFYDESVYVEGVMESSLAPLIDMVMRDNAGVYVKSHPKGRESTPHIEVHLSVMTDDDAVAEGKLRRAVAQLSILAREAGGLLVFG